eukprot:7825815-Pyramimonas_sp.AAC.1
MEASCARAPRSVDAQQTDLPKPSGVAGVPAPTHTHAHVDLHGGLCESTPREHSHAQAASRSGEQLR